MSRPLRILEMPTRFGMGGIARHVLGLSAWLAARGHAVHLAGTPSLWAGPVTHPGFLALDLAAVSEEGGSLPARLLAAARAAARLRAWLRANPVDLIHAHESAPALVARLARPGLGLPLAVTYHGAEPGRVAAFGRIARGADLVITPSHRSAADLAAAGGVPRAKLRVIGLGVAPPPPADPAAVAALRAALLGDGGQLVVTLARITRQKGIDILLETAARVTAADPSVRFALVGDGEARAAMEARAAALGLGPRFVFAGRTETPHLFLRAADLFLLTSRWEALPFTIVEAFQAGLPAVATDCGGVAELIDGTVGAVVPREDVPAIAAAVQALLGDPARRRAMAAAALARAGEPRFDPAHVHARFEETYRALAGGRPAGGALAPAAGLP
jgi:glycosyltransferase involved in cell wall biosynthesis